MEILLRFNHSAQNDNERWRFVIDGKELTCSNAIFHCPVRTIQEKIWNTLTLTYDEKWHITPIDPKKIIINIDKNEIEVI
jgi:hypothetical protein